jgi:hypothetical protein
VARRRQEASNSPLIPLLLSLRLYTALGDSTGKDATNRTVSSRWLWLASVYSAAGRTVEEAFTIAVALHYETLEKSLTFEAIDPQAYTLRVLASHTKGIIQLGPTHGMAAISSEKSNGLVARLVSLCASDPLPSGSHFHAGVQDFSPSRIAELLVNLESRSASVDPDLVEMSRQPFDTAALFDVLFSKSACSAPLSSCNDALNFTLALEILETLGNRLQNSEPQRVDDPSLVVFSHVVKRGLSLLETICESDQERRVFCALFYLSASVCLVSRHSLFDFDTWNLQRSNVQLISSNTSCLLAFASSLSEDASELVTSPDHRFDDMSILAAIISQSIAVYRFQLDSLQGRCAKPACSESMILLLGQLAETFHTSSETTETRNISRWCFLSLLSRLCDSFAADGETLQALLLSSWNMRVAGNTPFEASAWFEATTMSIQALDTPLSRNVYRAESGGNTSAYEVELKASTLRQRLPRIVDQRDLLDIEHRFHALLTTIDNLNAEGETPLLLWAKSTTLLGLSELAQKLRRFDDGRHFAGSCFKVCRALSRSGVGLPVKADRPTGAFDEVATAMLLTRSWMRQVDCLKVTSQCYRALGDRLKSVSYAERALRLVSSNNEDSFFHLQLPDFIAFSRSRPCSTSREMQCRRFLFLMKARATTWDRLIDQFQSEWRLCTKPLSTALRLGCSVNHVLEEVYDLETGTLTLSTRLRKVGLD